MMNVPLLDLKAQYASVGMELEAAVLGVLESQQFILGPVVEACERAVADYCGCLHGIGMSSGSDALLACLMAENIGPGDEVITSTYTFFATVGAIARVGATPVLVDIDQATFNMDCSQIESRVTSRTRAIVPVHLYGQMANMDVVMAVANRHGLVVIEDAAQAIGAEDRGRRAGSVGHYGCLSFFPSKNLGAAGDGGMVVTNDAARAERLRILRTHGAKPKYVHSVIGGNFRLDAIQASVVHTKLRHLDGWTAARQWNARRYERLFTEGGLVSRIRSASHVQLPALTADRHVFNQYVIRIDARDRIQSELKARGIGTEVYYPVPMHLQQCFEYLGHRPGEFPQSEHAAATSLALPVYPELTDEQARYVVDCLSESLVPIAAKAGHR